MLTHSNPFSNIKPRSSPSSSSTTSTFANTPEEIIEMMRTEAYDNYERLKNHGGRPCCEINPDPGPCPPSKSDIDKEYHIMDHWSSEQCRTKWELSRWEKFRNYQEQVRACAERFDEYKTKVSKFQQENSIGWSLELQQRWQTQSKLAEWREYYVYEYWKRRGLEDVVRLAERETESAEERLRAIESSGATGGIDLSYRAEESVIYGKKMSEARREVELAQNRLEAVKANVLLDAVEKDASIKRAQEGLDAAQKRLNITQSDELDILDKEFEWWRVKKGIKAREARVRSVKVKIEKLDSLLKWIE